MQGTCLKLDEAYEKFGKAHRSAVLASTPPGKFPCLLMFGRSLHMFLLLKASLGFTGIRNSLKAGDERDTFSHTQRTPGGGTFYDLMADGLAVSLFFQLFRSLAESVFGLVVLLGAFFFLKWQSVRNGKVMTSHHSCYTMSLAITCIPIIPRRSSQVNIAIASAGCVLTHSCPLSILQLNNSALTHYLNTIQS